MISYEPCYTYIVGLFQIFNHVKTIEKTTKITISQKTPFFKIKK